MEFYT